MNPHHDNCGKNMGFACTCGYDVRTMQDAALVEKTLVAERAKIWVWMSCEIFEARLDPEKVLLLKRLRYAICRCSLDPTVSLDEMDIPTFSGEVE